MFEKRIKIAFFGTADFAVPALLALLSEPEKYNVCVVVSQPDRPVGRNKEIQSPPVVTIAKQHNLLLLQPEKINQSIIDKLKEIKIDIFIVAAYGIIISKELLALPKFGALNLHGSILPKYRGASPIQSAILAGETETGVTLMLMDEKLDHGPIISTTNEKIEETDDYLSLSNRLAEKAANLLIADLPKYLKGEIKPQNQPHDQATFTYTLKKADALIDINQTNAWEIERQTRAYRPWPGTCLNIFQKNGAQLMIKLHQVEVIHLPTEQPGKISINKDGFPAIQINNDEAIKLLSVQPIGKNIMAGNVFWHGYGKLF